MNAITSPPCGTVLRLLCVQILEDNLSWMLLNREHRCLVVDPGEAAPLLELIDRIELTLEAVLITHQHEDHTGGVGKLLNRHPSAVVYGAENFTRGETPTAAELHLLGRRFTVTPLPGHTREHIGFYSPPWFFCGDTMFSAGCGRPEKGSLRQLYLSLQKINHLPPETVICPGHEYTQTNLEFALDLFPEDSQLAIQLDRVKRRRSTGRSSLPSRLNLERRINLFLRCQERVLQERLGVPGSDQQDWDCFARLRGRKNTFPSTEASSQDLPAR